MIIHSGKPPIELLCMAYYTNSSSMNFSIAKYFTNNIWIPHYRIKQNVSCRGIHISAYNFAHYILHVMNICNGNQMLCTCNYGDKTTINRVNLTYLSFVKSFIKVKFLIRVGHRINIIYRTTIKKELIEYYYILHSHK